MGKYRFKRSIIGIPKQEVHEIFDALERDNLSVKYKQDRKLSVLEKENERLKTEIEILESQKVQQPVDYIWKQAADRLNETLELMKKETDKEIEKLKKQSNDKVNQWLDNSKQINQEIQKTEDLVDVLLEEFSTLLEDPENASNIESHIERLRKSFLPSKQPVKHDVEQELPNTQAFNEEKETKGAETPEVLAPLSTKILDENTSIPTTQNSLFWGDLSAYVKSDGVNEQKPHRIVEEQNVSNQTELHHNKKESEVYEHPVSQPVEPDNFTLNEPKPVEPREAFYQSSPSSISKETPDPVEEDDEFVQEIQMLQSKYMIGKTVGQDLYKDNGELIVRQGDKISANVVRMANEHGKLADLIINMQMAGYGD